MPSTGRIKHFKLYEILQVLTGGGFKNKMLQRIYGTAFLAKKHWMNI